MCQILHICAIVLYMAKNAGSHSKNKEINNHNQTNRFYICFIYPYSAANMQYTIVYDQRFQTLIYLHLFTDCFHADFSSIIGTNTIPVYDLAECAKQ